MKTLFGTWKSISLIAACSLLAGCFHLQTPADFPTSLRKLHVTTYNVNSNISTPLKRQLQAAGATLTHNAPFTLNLSNSRTTVDMPFAFNNTAATSYRYKMSVHLRLTSKNNKTILNMPLTESQSVIHNVNQVDSPVITPLMRRTLTRRLINSIFDVLTSVNTQKQLKPYLAHR